MLSNGPVQTTRGEQDDGHFRAGPSPKKLAEAFKQVPRKCLFCEARAHNSS